MSGHEMCAEGIYSVTEGKSCKGGRNSSQATPRPAVTPSPSKPHAEIETYKDKVIADLKTALLYYAGEQSGLGLRVACDIDFSKHKVSTFRIRDVNGDFVIARDESVAREVLKEYNLIE